MFSENIQSFNLNYQFFLAEFDYKQYDNNPAILYDQYGHDSVTVTLYNFNSFDHFINNYISFSCTDLNLHFSGYAEHLIRDKNNLILKNAKLFWGGISKKDEFTLKRDIFKKTHDIVDGYYKLYDFIGYGSRPMKTVYLYFKNYNK